MMESFRLKYPIDGVPTEVEIKDIELDLIDLDPENPRIGYWSDNQIKEAFSQDEIAFALHEKSDEINQLKLSIEVNEGAIEPIWVCIENDRYLVIDGNTRLEIYRALRKKYPRKDVFKKIRCKILPEGIDNKAKDFIRLIAHLRGVNEWQVYERARMLYILWERKGYTEEELQATTKLNPSEIRKWIQAYRDMTEQYLPKYGNQRDALSKFSYFVEFENPTIQSGMKKAGLTTEDFADWVGKKHINRAQDVRNLRKIFANKNARESLVDDGYQYAVEKLRSIDPGVYSKLFEAVEDVTIGLRNMTREEEEEIVEGDAPHKARYLIELFKELRKVTDKINENLEDGF